MCGIYVVAKLQYLFYFTCEMFIFCLQQCDNGMCFVQKCSTQKIAHNSVVAPVCPNSLQIDFCSYAYGNLSLFLLCAH